MFAYILEFYSRPFESPSERETEKEKGTSERETEKEKGPSERETEKETRRRPVKKQETTALNTVLGHATFGKYKTERKKQINTEKASGK